MIIALWQTFLNPQETFSYGLPADFNLSTRIARRSVWDGFFCCLFGTLTELIFADYFH